MSEVKEDKKVRCDVQLLKKGDKLSRISYMEVVSHDRSSTTVRNQEGLEWSIGNNIVAEECLTANQHNEEVEVTRTELAKIFSEVGDAVFTVNFHKQPKVEEVFDEIANTGKLISNSEMKKKLKEGMKGQKRTLVGYLVQPEPLLGRSTVVDMEVPKGEHNLRLVDHRGLNFLIVKNVKYIVKSK